MNNQTSNFSHKAGKWMIVFAWLIVIGLMTLFFSKVLDQKRNPNQNINTHVLEGGQKEVVLKSSAHGHYVATGKINQQKVVFLVDIGASFVSVPEKVARKAGLKKGAPITAMTANGNVTVYATILDSISLGDIVLHDVKADINPHMKGEEILLGMSFLRNLSVTHQDGTLTIRQ